MLNEMNSSYIEDPSLVDAAALSGGDSKHCYCVELVQKQARAGRKDALSCFPYPPLFFPHCCTICMIECLVLLFLFFLATLL